jgi:PhnB protein
MTKRPLPPLPEGYNTINPFIVTRDALKTIEFLKTVFGATEDMAAHTIDTDGLLIHAELIIGNSRVLLADTKPGWPFTPSLLQVYVGDIEATLKRAEELGAKIVTKPTDFYGFNFSRFVDPWDNLWWVYQHNPQSGASWEEGTSTSESWEPTEEMLYIYDTLLETMRNLGKSSS